MTELKPCPFCGGEAQLGVQIMCQKCHASVPAILFEVDQSGVDAAIAAWNRRQPPPPAAVGEERRYGHDGRFKLYGTTDCRSCEAGRVSLFIANERCIECDPDSYRAARAKPSGEWPGEEEVAAFARSVCDKAGFINPADGAVRSAVIFGALECATWLRARYK